MDVEIIIAIIGVSGVIIGAILGACLNHYFSSKRNKTQNYLKQIIVLQEENNLLKDENVKLKDVEAVEQRIIPINNTLFKLKDDKNLTIYCHICWGRDKKKIPVAIYYELAAFSCNNCKNEGEYYQR